MNPFDVRIHIKNQAEKLAALHVLSKVTGFPVSSGVLDNTVNDVLVKDYPYVYCLDGMVSASCDAARNPANNIMFSEIHKLFKASQKKVDLNNQYEAIVTADSVKVGCQTFSHAAIDELWRVSKEMRENG